MPSLPCPPAEKDPCSHPNRSRVFIRPDRALVRRCLAACLLLGPISAEADLIHWGSQGFVENADSHGAVWDAAYSMVIGVFRNGFIPTYENREQWAAQWRELGTASYDVEEKRFAGVTDTAVSADVAAGSQVYFWGKNGTDLTKGPEWVLLSNALWKWPAKSTAIAPAAVWTTGGGPLSLIVGEAESGGKHLISRALRPVPVAEAAWLGRYFENQPASAKPEADPDGDGMSNSLEYFLGSDPSEPSSLVGPQIESGRDSVTLNLRRNPYAVSDPVLEASEDLAKWAPVDHELLVDRPDLLQAAVPKDHSKKMLFFRFQFQSPAADR